LRNCANLVSASLPSLVTIGANAFDSSTSLGFINLPALSGSDAIGGSPANNSVFNNTALSGSIIVPSFYSQSNAGGLDGDLSYLSSSRNWTINWL